MAGYAVCRTGDIQNGEFRTGHPEWDRQNRSSRTEQAEQDRQNGAGITGQAEQDRYNITVHAYGTIRTGSVEQTSITAQAEWDI